MKKTLLVLGTVAALSPAIASAAFNKGIGIGPYFGGSYGPTQLDLSSTDKATVNPGGSSFDDTDHGFKLFGGYRVHPNVALEGFYSNLGETTFTETTSLGATAVGMFPVAAGLEVTGKVGFQAWDMDTTPDLDGTDVTFGIGAIYNMGQVSFRADIDHFVLDESSLNMLSAGVMVHF